MKEQKPTKVVTDHASPARNRVVDYDKVKPTRCIHGRPFTPRVELDVTLCPSCELEVDMLERRW